MTTRDLNPELLDVLNELRRHLEWQHEDGTVRAILVERSAATSAAPPQRAAPAAPPAVKADRTATPPAPTPAPAPAAARPLAPEGAAPARAPRAMQGSNVSSQPSGATARAAQTSLPSAGAHTGRTGAAPVVARTISELPAPEPISDEERRTLDEVRREIGDCQRCKLCSGRKNIVFGTGNPRAQLVFVGEGPGAEEDIQGMPFVGAAGQLLTKMIEAMGFTRDEVYICNVVKCRPPNNRNPEIDEIAACEPFLRAQLAAIQPKVIVALGKFAAHTLLREETAITRLRGQWREYLGIPVMPTFHPAYLLRNSAEKKNAWADLQQVMKLLGKAPQRRGDA